MQCDICKQEPAVYGDPNIQVRCAKCEALSKAEKVKDLPSKPQEEGGFNHPLVSNLVSIVMPVYMANYPLFHYTGNAIGSIRQNTSKENTNYELIVIDNGSPLKVPNLQAFYADKVIVNQSNLGVTVAWNQGIRASFGEYIVLINNDVQVFDGWMDELKKVIDSGEADLVMAHPMYSLTEPFARAEEARKVLRGEKKFDNLERDFSCVMFKKSLYDEIGAFDEQFFSYCSDSDFLKRMEQAGKKFKMVDKVAIHHISDATGYSIESTPEIMNEDKKAYADKWSRPTATEIQATPEQIQRIQKKIEETSPFQLIIKDDAMVEEIQDNNLVFPEFEFVRSNETGDKIYLLKGNILHWIKDPETFKTLGGEFGREIILDKVEFEDYRRGEPINMSNVDKYQL